VNGVPAELLGDPGTGQAVRQAAAAAGGQPQPGADGGQPLVHRQDGGACLVVQAGDRTEVEDHGAHRAAAVQHPADDRVGQPAALAALQRSGHGQAGELRADLPRGGPGLEPAGDDRGGPCRPLAHYTRLAALDLCPRIRVNAIAPGSIATSALDIVASNDELREEMEKATPIRRLGEPDEIAAAAVYLASPAGAYLTGKVIEVDGGITFPNLDLPIPDL